MEVQCFVDNNIRHRTTDSPTLKREVVQ